MAQSDKSKSKSNAGLFIPAGMFLGFGFGFLIDNVPAGLFVGMGLGFLTYGIVTVFYKK